ncbi:MAG: cellulase family glycosylhydrolase [Candidatus Marinimicrobia bacterium]|nr:cellulase family glycosylhydrolase [Candidatus Neomarinimicrobiota bacterium]
MWTEWRPEELSGDIKRMRGLGMNCCRPFLFMPAFLENARRVNPVMLERLKYFLNICEENELYTFPTFIVGHMSGEDWNLPWLKNTDLIKDRRFSEAIKFYITTVVKAVKNFKYIQGWLLSNELPNFIGKQNPIAVTDWVKEMVGAIRRIDPKRLVSIGDGAWSPEIIAEQTSFHLRKLNPLQDFVGLHYYPRGMDAWHHSFTTAFRTQLAKVWGKPVIVEEFGTSTTLCSEENQANYYRNVFFSALINGAQGALGWCLNDFDFEDKRPYSHHLFEERFGVVRTDQSLKPAAVEFEKLREISDELINRDYNKIESDCGLFIPSNYYYDYPYTFKIDGESLYEYYLECFCLMKRANLDVRMMVEPAQELENDGRYSHALNLVSEDMPVLFLPGLKFMTKQTRIAFENYLQNGGVAYFSYANDSWITDWDKLAGVITDCKFGVPDFRGNSEMIVKVENDWGQFRKGEQFVLSLSNNRPALSYCSIISTTARVIMTDQFGMPFLLENQVGKGKVYFSPYPLEALSWDCHNEDVKNNIGRIYKSINRLNRKQPEITIDGDGLEYGVWESQSDYRVVILNHSWQEQVGKLNLFQDYQKLTSDLPDFNREQDNEYRFTLPRKGVGYLKIQKGLKS